MTYCESAANSYFSTRFGGSGIPPGAERVDSCGRSIYGIDRDGELFQSYVLPYLLDNDVDIKPFTEDPLLWRRLRKEANFYCLQGLVDKLHVTHSCQPNRAGQGLFYWLAERAREKKSSYLNPYSRNAVDVTGWVDTGMSNEEIRSRLPRAYFAHVPNDHRLSGCTSASRSVLMQYRPPVKGLSNGDRMLEALVPCEIFCQFSASGRLPVIVDLKSIVLRPTAYSLRYDRCVGMSDWNFEAATNGSDWDVLHQARGDTHLLQPTRNELRELEDNLTERMSERDKADAFKHCSIMWSERTAIVGKSLQLSFIAIFVSLG